MQHTQGIFGYQLQRFSLEDKTSADNLVRFINVKFWEQPSYEYA
jgi:hypothetical protein